MAEEVKGNSQQSSNQLEVINTGDNHQLVQQEVNLEEGKRPRFHCLLC